MTFHYRKISTTETDVKKDEKRPLIPNIKAAQEYQQEHEIKEEAILHKRENLSSDIEEQQSFKLIYQHIENLREKVGKTPHELIELEDLEMEYKKDLEDLEAIPKNLGVPSKIDQLQAAIASKMNNVRSEKYDGGDDVEESYSSVNQEYIDLFGKSWLNKKTIRFLNQQIQVLSTGQRDISIFDVFDKPQIGKVFSRCCDLVTSPIYERMQEIKEDYYALQFGIQMKFKDKSAKFLVPFKEFQDIPKVSLNIPAYIEFSMVLPPSAQEKKRHFKKGATIEDFTKYLAKLGLQLEGNQKEYMEKLKDGGKLRLYHETLDVTDEVMVRAYFLNLTGMYREQQYELEERFYGFFKNNEQIHVGRVLPHKNLPDWMKKIGGLIIEQADGDFVSFHKNKRQPQEILIQSNILDEYFLMPSSELTNSDIAINEWKRLYYQELREKYQKNALMFKQYSIALKNGTTQLQCSCGSKHQEKCPKPVLEEIFQYIS